MLNIRAYLFGNVGIALASLRLIYDLVYFIEVCLVLLEHFKGWAVFFFLNNNGIIRKTRW